MLVCVKNCKAAGFFTLKSGPPPKVHPGKLTQVYEALESACVSIPVKCFRHLVESMLQQIEGLHLNIRKVFLMFGILKSNQALFIQNISDLDCSAMCFTGNTLNIYYTTNTR